MLKILQVLMGQQQENQQVCNMKKLINFSREVHDIASAMGHALVWNITNPEKHIGRCPCGLVSEVTMDGSDTLTESGTLKKCKMSERNAR